MIVAPLLTLVLLSQTRPMVDERTLKGLPDEGVQVELEQTREDLVGAKDPWDTTRATVIVRNNERLGLRVDVSRVAKFGQEGYGTGLQADVRATNDLRALVGFAIGDRSVLAESVVGTTLLYSGVRYWKGFVLLGGATYTSFGDSRSFQATAGALQYLGPLLLSYSYQNARSFPGSVTSYHHNVGALVSWEWPLAMDFGVNVGFGLDRYLATYINPPPLVELDGYALGAQLRAWFTDTIGMQLGFTRGQQWWTEDKPVLDRTGGGLTLLLRL